MLNPKVPIRDDRREFPSLDRPSLFIKLLRTIGFESFEGLRVVDLGAGYGSLSIGLARLGSKVTAVDAAGHQIEELERRAALENVEVTAYTSNLLEDLRYVSDMDMAIMVGVVEYAGMWSESESVDTLQLQVLRTAFETLRPGGSLVLCTKNRIWPFFAIRDVHTSLPLVNVLPRSMAEMLAGRLGRGSYRLYIHSPGKWSDMLREAGFTKVQVFYPFLSYQYPIGVSSKPSFTDVAALPKPQGEPENVRVMYGRFWRAKAIAMAIFHHLRIPMSHSVVIKAVR